MGKKHGRPASVTAGLSGGRLRGGWLVLARSVWLLVTLSTLGLFAVSIPPGYGMLRTVCTDGRCGPEQLSPEGARTIEQFGFSLEWYSLYQTALVVVFALVFFAIGATIFWRRSDDFMALYTSLTLVLAGVFLPEWMGLLAPLYPVLWLPLDLLNSLTYCSLFILFYLFPDGRFTPRWTRWPALVWIAFQGVHYVYYVFPYGALIPEDWPPVLLALLLTGLVGTCLFAQVYRYRRVSSPEQRQQTKWVVFGLIVMLSVLILATVPPAFAPSLDDPGRPYDLGVDLVSFWAVLLVPLTFGVAILRYRLFDADVLINRALVYAILTVALAGVYVGSVVLLQGILRGLTGETSQIVVVASTLIIAALFNPLRRRVQAFIDQRFYRGKYDAARTLEAFNARLRDGMDLEDLSGNLTSVVGRTLQPEHVSLWLREPGKEGDDRRL